MQMLLKKLIKFLSLLVKDNYVPYNQQYKDMLEVIVAEGASLDDRTKVGRVSIPSYSLKVDLRRETPTMNLRKAPVKAPCDEMIGFIRAYTNSADFSKVGCDYWHQNANENKSWLNNPFRKGTGDLGAIYGDQWCNWQGFNLLDPNEITIDGDLADLCGRQDHLIATGWKYGGDVLINGDNKQLWHKRINQLAEAVHTIINDPDSRRCLFHGWNPAVLDKVALPSCHVLYQFLCFDGVLHLTTYQR
jgi:thymidylate synthase